MPEYLSPGVYIEDYPSVAPMEGASTTVGGFIGISQRGPVNEPVYITSWNGYIEKFAYGMDSPFLPNSDLAYAVYGFFQNGGKKCYVVRTAHTETAKAAECSLKEPDTILINAKDEGAWGNRLKISITANEVNASNFDITVKYNEEVVEVLSDLSNTEGDKYWVDYVNDNSNFISAISGTLAAKDGTFASGADGATDIEDADFVASLPMFDTVDDVNMIAIPGQTSNAVQQGMISYIENRGDIFGIFDSPETADVEAVLELRKRTTCSAGELLFPWIKVSDPLSSSGKTRVCPPSGHVMGVIARIILSRGVWKAPAGTEAVVRGAIETTVYLPQGETDRLNPAGVVSILSKPNAGIVVWGSRSMSADSSMKYVSDILLDIYIKKTTYNNTQQFVFEPNAPETWTKVVSTISGFLDTLWRDGGLYGNSAQEAYYVKCDEDLNTESVRKSGRMITEIGYASKKPAEFVIFRFHHDVSNS